MNLKELLYRSLGYRFQKMSTSFKSLDIKKKFGELIIRKGTSDIRVFKQIFLDEVYFCFPENFNPKVIIDAGANVGYSAVWFASKFPNSIIYAIEPEASNFETMLRNLGTHGNVVPIKAGLWNVMGFLKINNPKAESWSFRTSLADEGSSVMESVTIPSLIDRFDIEYIDLLKIDIEGSEFELFSNDANEWLPKVKMIMIEIHEEMRPGCTELIDEVVQRFGFSKFITRELSVYFKP